MTFDWRAQFSPTPSRRRTPETCAQAFSVDMGGLGAFSFSDRCGIGRPASMSHARLPARGATSRRCRQQHRQIWARCFLTRPRRGSRQRFGARVSGAGGEFPKLGLACGRIAIYPDAAALSPGRPLSGGDRQELEALGHAAVSPLAALRARCVDCCAGAVSEVRRCRQTTCPSWPFRMGSDPWKEPTDAQLAAVVQTPLKRALPKRRLYRYRVPPRPSHRPLPPYRRADSGHA